MNSNIEADSVVFSLGELRQIEHDRVEEEHAALTEQLRIAEAAKLRQAEAAAEAVRTAERAIEAERARAEAERVTRELTLRVAQIQAEAAVERERHATERARLDAALATARPPAPAPRWPVWAALALSVATMIGSALWIGRALDDERARAGAGEAALRSDLGARLDEVVRRTDAALRAAEDAIDAAIGE
jgi:hypothetical protein